MAESMEVEGGPLGSPDSILRQNSDEPNPQEINEPNPQGNFPLRILPNPESMTFHMPLELRSRLLGAREMLRAGTGFPLPPSPGGEFDSIA